MPRVCTICIHPQRNAVDAALIRGETAHALAARFDLKPSSIHRHKEDHLPAKLAKAKDAAEVANADTLLDQAQSLQQRALAILSGAEEEKQFGIALGAIREARGCLELLGKLGSPQEREIIVR